MAEGDAKTAQMVGS